MYIREIIIVYVCRSSHDTTKLVVYASEMIFRHSVFRSNIINYFVISQCTCAQIILATLFLPFCSNYCTYLASSTAYVSVNSTYS